MQNVIVFSDVAKLQMSFNFIFVLPNFQKYLKFSKIKPVYPLQGKQSIFFKDTHSITLTGLLQNFYKKSKVTLYQSPIGMTIQHFDKRKNS